MNQTSGMDPRPASFSRHAGPFSQLAVAACFIACGLGVVVAQTITAPAGSPTITHDGKDQVQVFSEGTWTLTNSTAVKGATAVWKCPAFDNAGRKANCRLNIRILTADQNSNWGLVTSQHDSDFSKSQQAEVSAASTFLGNATVGLIVTFLQSDYSLLRRGNYQATVTGTISANP